MERIKFFSAFICLSLLMLPVCAFIETVAGKEKPLNAWIPQGCIVGFAVDPKTRCDEITAGPYKGNFLCQNVVVKTNCIKAMTPTELNNISQQNPSHETK